MIINKENIHELVNPDNAGMRQVDLTGPEGNVFNVIGITKQYAGDLDSFFMENIFGMLYDDIVAECDSYVTDEVMFITLEAKQLLQDNEIL
jgi:hypothetical protein